MPSHDKIDYSGLPESLQDGARLWIERGYWPGGFLTAVIENNLVEAFGRADTFNFARLGKIVGWWYNEAPAPCWGSVERARAWHESYEPPKPRSHLDDGSNAEIAEREDFDAHELDVP